MPSIMYKESKLKVMDAPEPTNVFWENLSKRYQGIKQLISFLVTLGMAVGAFYLIRIFTQQ